jgi:hypothetical protein
MGMKQKRKNMKLRKPIHLNIAVAALSPVMLAAAMLSANATLTAHAAPAVKAAAKKAPTKAAAKPAAKTPMVPLKLALPKPGYLGTPKNISGTTAERPTGKPRPAVFVPVGTRNVAQGKAVTGSDDAPIIGSLDLITDGDKQAVEGSWVELGPGTQWVQIDLKQPYTLSYLVMWHFHGEARVYRDVVVQVADDADFIKGVRTVFNNDRDNSSGLGLGKDREFFESAEGKLVNMKGVKARYVRLYSKGNTSDDQNHYTEVEVYGK